MKPPRVPQPSQRLFEEDGLTETAKIDVRIPRDREGRFDPKLIQRYQRRFPGFDDKIVSMCTRAA